MIINVSNLFKNVFQIFVIVGSLGNYKLISKILKYINGYELSTNVFLNIYLDEPPFMQYLTRF